MDIKNPWCSLCLRERHISHAFALDFESFFSVFEGEVGGMGPEAGPGGFGEVGLGPVLEVLLSGGSVPLTFHNLTRDRVGHGLA